MPGRKKRLELVGLDEPVDEGRFQTDPVHFFESCLKITTKRGKLERLKLNKEQRAVFRRIWADWQAGKPVRYIILKARQLGFSTLIEAFLYWLSSNFSHVNSLVLAHENEASRNLLRMSQRFAQYDLRHELGCMPMQANVNRYELTFQNPNWRTRKDDPGLGSRMHIATADNKSAGHSSTLRAFHGSEVARWKSAEVMTGVMEALPYDAETIAVLESTAYGAYGVFYEHWVQAEKGLNGWTPIFVSWLERDEYQVKPPLGFEPTAHEEQLIREHGLTWPQLAWRRVKIDGFKGQGRPAEDIFMEQYPLTPEEAFRSTGKNYFDLGAITWLEKQSLEVPYLNGIVALNAQPRKGIRPVATFEENRAGNLRIWKMPQPGNDYVIGADVSAGIKGCDWSVAYVMNRTTLEYVARYRAIVDPRKFKDELIALAWFYNEAFLAPEANSIGTLVAREVAEKYIRCCYHVTLGETSMEQDWEKPGWYTTAHNRKQMMATMRQAVGEGGVRIWCEDFLREAKTFVVPEDAQGKVNEASPRAEKKKHDDCVMAATITFWVSDPNIAGPIRRPPPSAEPPPPDWRHAALRSERDAERAPPDRRYFDNDVGEW